MIFEIENILYITVVGVAIGLAFMLYVQFEIEAYGVASDLRQYVGATYREVREILALFMHYGNMMVAFM